MYGTSGTSIRETGGNFTSVNTSGTQSTVTTVSLNYILYTPYNIYENSSSTNISINNGAYNVFTMYITNENDGSILIYLPQNIELLNTDYLYLEFLNYSNNEFLVFQLNTEEFNEYNTSGRFWVFTGEQIGQAFDGLTNTATYSLYLKYNDEIVAVSPKFNMYEVEDSSTGGGSGEDTGGNIDTGKIEEELGNINSSIQQGNDYIMQDAVYDENGNLAEEQPGLIGKILQGFWNVLIKFFDWLMVPDEEQISDVVDDVLENDLISESVLGLPLQLISRFLNLFENRTYTDWIIIWDDVNFTFTENDGSEIDMKMFNAYTFNISEFVRNDETLSKIYSYYLILVNFGAVCGLIYWGFGLAKGLLGIEDSMPGANDETESPAVNSTPEESGESDAEALERFMNKQYGKNWEYNPPLRNKSAYRAYGRYKSIYSDMKAGRYKKK